jgi:hypothetical protein
VTSRIVFKQQTNGVRYRYLNDSGGLEPVPSVTTIVGQEAKPNLVAAAAKVAADAMNDNWADMQGLAPSRRWQFVSTAHVRKWYGVARAKGVQIHAWAEELLAGRPIEVPEEYQGQVQRFADWWTASGFVMERAETIVWSQADDLAGIRYAGRYDCLAVHPRHGWTLLDWKTGESGIWPEAGVQLAGYADADFEVIDGQDKPMQKVDTLAAVNIRLDGTTIHVLNDEQRRIAQERWQVLRLLYGVGKPEFQELI